MKGRFLSFEGPDKAGKSTQVPLFCEYLAQKGIPYLVTREPGGCPVSEKIRALILDPDNDMGDVCEALLYAAARSELVRTVLRPALEQGTWVVCDRYVDSSIAYQGYGRGLGEETVRRINHIATGGLRPDLSFYFRIDPQIALQRATGEKDRIERANDAFRRRVAQGYEALYQAEPRRYCLIDAAQSVPQVHRQIIDGFESWVASCI